MSHRREYDVIGIGVGVFNLSLAALLADNGHRDAMFFDAQPEMTWHGGMLLESSELQALFLKDLVTPVDPTSRYSFLNYLNERGILYQFMNRKTLSVSRTQFQHYFRWVAGLLDNVRFGSAVESVRHAEGCFHVVVGGVSYRARHLAVGTGIAPVMPPCATPHLGERVLSVRDYAHHCEALAGGRIVVVGGGQSGAEVVLDIMANVEHTSLGWYGRRLSFAQLEDDCFINELFVPSFTTQFREGAPAHRAAILDRLAMASDGVSQTLLDLIYRLAFERSFFGDRSDTYDFRAGQDLVAITQLGSAYELTLRSSMRDELWSAPADAVVLATGFRPICWDLLADVLGPEFTDYRVGPAFDVTWEHGNTNRIFVQNSGPITIGLAEPNLSVAAWRASMIANAILGKEVYTSRPDRPLVHYA